MPNKLLCNLALFSIAAGISVSAGGCAAPLLATGAGLSAFQAGGSAYIRGELESAEVVEMHTLFQLVQDVLVEEFAFEIAVARAGDNYAFIHTKETQGRMIRVNLERKSPVVTKINVRVGLFGDQPMSRLILGGIQAHIPAPPMRTPSLDAVLRVLDDNQREVEP